MGGEGFTPATTRADAEFRQARAWASHGGQGDFYFQTELRNLCSFRVAKGEERAFSWMMKGCGAHSLWLSSCEQGGNASSALAALMSALAALKHAVHQCSVLMDSSWWSDSRLRRLPLGKSAVTQSPQLREHPPHDLPIPALWRAPLARSAAGPAWPRGAGT